MSSIIFMKVTIIGIIMTMNNKSCKKGAAPRHAVTGNGLFRSHDLSRFNERHFQRVSLMYRIFTCS